MPQMFWGSCSPIGWLLVGFERRLHPHVLFDIGPYTWVLWDDWIWRSCCPTASTIENVVSSGVNRPLSKFSQRPLLSDWRLVLFGMAHPFTKAFASALHLYTMAASRFNGPTAFESCIYCTSRQPFLRGATRSVNLQR